MLAALRRTFARRERRWLVPEVVQTSSMDCGPASLACLLEGFRVHASYGRLREACQTDLDGTSIDTIEEILTDVGFRAQQLLVPAEHLVLPEVGLLPAVAVCRDASGYPHFVVLWAVNGPLVQVMDPAVGRRWLSRDELLRSLYRHTMPVSTEGWRAWAGSRTFARALEIRLGELGVDEVTAHRWIDAARADAGWRTLAALDATARMASQMVRAGAIAAGREAADLADALFARARQSPGVIPARFWAVNGRPENLSSSGIRPSEPAAQGLSVTGAVIVHVDGLQKRQPDLSPELVAALEEAPARPWQKLGALLWTEARNASLGLAGLVVAMSSLMLFEVLILRALIDGGRELVTTPQRVVAAVVVAVFFGALLALHWATFAISQSLGRRIETALRLAFHRKIARLGMQYFRSRPPADVAERVHSLRRLRALPDLAFDLLASTAALAANTAGILLIDPHVLGPALATVAISIAIPLAMQSVLTERELRVRTHAGALSQLYLEALLGLVPIRTHGAERAVRGVHEGLLGEWRQAGRRLMRATVATHALGELVLTAFVAWLLLDYLATTADKRGVLLVLYWALSFGYLGQEFANAIVRYPVLRNITERLVELLGAPDERDPRPSTGTESLSDGAEGGVALRFDQLTVRAGGHTILRDLDVEIDAGAHVAIVGVSGAGKSTFIASLLGLHQAAEGAIWVDGQALTGDALERLRRETAWVDPAVRLWNEPVLSNLLYGADGEASPAVGALVETAGLRALLDGMPEGMQTTLGEGGVLVSGGEGQCVRLGRALARSNARLVLLDEPFRGLDAARRRVLLTKARAWWPRATLLCVTHDIAETLSFSRVLVLDGGSIVEDGHPRELAARSSRYAALLKEEKSLREASWGAAVWRRFRMGDGKLEEEELAVQAHREGSDSKSMRSAS